MAKKPTRSAAPRSSAPRSRSKPAAAAAPRAPRKPRPRAKAAEKPAVSAAALATAPNPLKLPPAAAPTYDQIARRAYEVWIARGCPSGMDVENWQEAERQLRSETPAHN